MENRERTEIDFPPQAGKLMLRSMYEVDSESRQRTLLEQDLHYFSHVGKVGETWRSQRIALRHHGGDPEPSITTFVENSTDSAVDQWRPDRLIEHTYATEEDLTQYVEGIKVFYVIRRGSSEPLRRWLEQVKENRVIRPEEKQRLEKAVTQAFGK